jgi:hypothetical protein
MTSTCSQYEYKVGTKGHPFPLIYFLPGRSLPERLRRRNSTPPPVLLPPLESGRRHHRCWKRRRRPSRQRTKGMVGYRSDGSTSSGGVVVVVQDDATLRQGSGARATIWHAAPTWSSSVGSDLGLRALSRPATGHGRIASYVLRPPSPLWLCPTAWGPTGVLE